MRAGLVKTTDDEKPVTLTICIGTFNRAQFIGELLDSILSQEIDDCEIVISDNASTDNTEAVVARFRQRYSRIRYFKQEENVGLDRNFDRAVSLASGTYCWLMADDDKLKQGAVARVLEELHKAPTLIVVNYECTNLDMSAVTLARRTDVSTDRRYSAAELDRLFVDTADHLVYLGCIIIDRSVWLSRNREPYYGSLFMHFAVIFQANIPGDTLFIADPLVAHRDGNPRTFWSEMFEVFMFRWPELIWSLAPSDSAKNEVSTQQPWRNPWHLLNLRALCLYSTVEYRRWISPRLSTASQKLAPLLVALIPGVLANMLLVMYYSLSRSRTRKVSLLLLRDSPFSVHNRWPFGRRAVSARFVQP
jgi:abequosyltransferase